MLNASHRPASAPLLLLLLLATMSAPACDFDLSGSPFVTTSPDVDLYEGPRLNAYHDGSYLSVSETYRVAIGTTLTLDVQAQVDIEAFDEALVSDVQLAQGAHFQARYGQPAQDADRIALEAIAPGQSELVIRGEAASSPGTMLTTRTTLDAQPATRITLAHACTRTTEGPDAKSVDATHYVTGGEIELDVSLFNDSNQLLWGDASSLLSLSTSTQMTFAAEPPARGKIRITTGDQPGAATLTPAVGDTALQFRLIHAADIDALDIVADEELGAFAVIPMSAGERVCQNDDRVAFEVLTPEVCKMDPTLEPFATRLGSVVGADGWPAVAMISTGDATGGACRLRITHRDAMGGAGLTVEREFAM